MLISYRDRISDEIDCWKCQIDCRQLEIDRENLYYVRRFLSLFFSIKCINIGFPGQFQTLANQIRKMVIQFIRYLAKCVYRSFKLTQTANDFIIEHSISLLSDQNCLQANNFVNVRGIQNSCNQFKKSRLVNEMLRMDEFE